MTGRFFRAWLVVRWRLMRHTLERGWGMGSMDRFARMTEIVAPILSALLVVPISLGLAALAFIWGWTMAAQGRIHPAALDVFRALGVSAMVVALFTPNWGAGGLGRGSTTRLLLLPVSRATLFFGELTAALANPWLLGFLPGLLLLPVGLAVGGAAAAAGLVSLATFLFLAVLAVLGMLAGTSVQLLLRNRRLWEGFILVGLALLILTALVPMAIEGEGRPLPLPLDTPSLATALVPSEALAFVLSRAVEGGDGVGTSLVLSTAVLAALGWTVFLQWKWALASVPSSGRRSAHRRRRPKHSSGAASPLGALVSAEMRYLLRTVRGRVALLFPALSLFVLLLALRELPLGGSVPGRLALGPALLLLGGGLAVMMLSSIALNQFAADGGGFSLLLLQPISLGKTVAAKGLAHGLLAAAATFLCLPLIFWKAGGSSPWLWLISVFSLLAGAAFYLPLSIALSALFPKPTDLGKLGRAGNAHPAAELVGALMVPALFGPGVAFLFWGILAGPARGVVGACLWLLVAGVVARLVSPPLVGLAAARTESLAQAAKRGARSAS